MTERDALLAALSRLHDAVLRHGLTEDTDATYLRAFQEVMAAMRVARDLIDNSRAESGLMTKLLNAEIVQVGQERQAEGFEFALTINGVEAIRVRAVDEDAAVDQILAVIGSAMAEPTP